MNSNLKNIISALAVVVFCIAAYFSWKVSNVRFVYLVILCLFEIVLSIAYMLFNRNKLTKSQAKAELFGIAAYSLIAIIITILYII